jgi:predicted enzyme involved in methoxymalonyl-ACP biosynthesis
VEGLVLGQGSALGEGFVHFQDYARELSRRGVILAVCSKNDEKQRAGAVRPAPRNGAEARRHRQLCRQLERQAGKPAHIAEELNIGIDALVFVDDNPFERDLVRRELPMVAVPEISDDPT